MTSRVHIFRFSLAAVLKLIQRAVDDAPGNASYLDSLGWAYFKLGKLSEAEKYLIEAARFSSSATVHEHLGGSVSANWKEATGARSVAEGTVTRE